MKVLNSNLNGLKKQRILPGFDVEIDLNEIKKVELKPSKKDGVFIETTISNQKVQIGSTYSENKLISKVISQLPIEKESIYFMIGFGTPKVIQSLLNTIPKSSALLCIDLSPQSFYKVATEIDISSILEDERFIFCLSKHHEKALARAKELLIHRLKLFQKSFFIETNRLTYSKEFIPKNFSTLIANNIKESIQLAKMVYTTNDVSIKHYFDNAINTLRYHDWDYVINSVRGKPLLILGIGPSLALEIDKVKQRQDYYYIGCVDNALREVLHHGIEPDFVFQVEWQKTSLDFYRDLDIPKKSILVFLGGIYPEILNIWPGQKLSYPGGQIRALFYDFLHKNIPNFVGTNVGMLAAQFAFHVKADPVVFVGYDLCSPLANYFHPNALHLWDIYPHLSRFCSEELQDYIFNSLDGELMEVSRKDGEIVWTSNSVEMGRASLGEHFKFFKSDSKFYSTSRYGLMFDFVEFKAFEEIDLRIEKKSKELLQPNQCTLNNETFINSCQKKSQQLKTYFRLLKQVILDSKDLVDLSKNKVSDEKIQLKTNDLHRGLNELQKDKSMAWIEVTMGELDRRLIDLADREKNARKDWDREDAIIQMAKNFLEKADVYLSYEEPLLRYLEKCTQKIKPS